jgi:quercetin dioxygenase-like cupin family protein
VLHAADAPALPIAGGKGTARLFLDGRGAPVAFDQLTAEAGVTIPPHRHEASDEIIYVLAGRGVTTVAGKDYPVAAGDVVHIPKGIEHSLKVTEPLTALQVYAPAGPEQRWKQPPPKGK